jgi:flagellar biosynthesis chaperone FliJ
MAEDVREKIQGFKKVLGRLQSSFDQANGSYNTVLKTLKDKFGFSSDVAAQKQLKDYEKKIEKLRNDLTKATATFEKKYKHLL